MRNWTIRFAVRRSARPTFALPDLHVPPRLRALLLPSLVRFQIGETGEGRHLLAAAHAADDPRLAAALSFFLAEEHDHARWLAEAVRSLGGETVPRHASASAFAWARHRGGLHGELLVLLIVELLGARYYRALANALPEPRLRALFARIHGDEGLHLAVLVDVLRERLARLSPWRRTALRLALPMALRAATLALLAGHGRLLHLLGVSPWRFWRETGRQFRCVLAALLPRRAAAQRVSAFAQPSGSAARHMRCSSRRTATSGSDVNTYSFHIRG